MLDAATGFWVYALPSPNQPTVSSGQRVGLDIPTTTPWQPRPSATLRTTLNLKKAMSRANYVGSRGTGLVPVLLGNFSDTTPTVSASTFNDMLFSTAPGSNSMSTYYTEVSYGKFTVSAGPSGIQNWINAPQPAGYYATNGVDPPASANDSTRADQFVRDVVVAAVAAGYNFAPYAQAGTGKVPVVCVVHAGLGEENGGGATSIWSHRNSLSASLGTNGPVVILTPNGPIVIDDFIIEPELQPKKNSVDGNDVVGIGVFCHEYGHALGLPDLYDTSQASEGVGNWSVMGSASYNGVQRDGDTPGHFDPWCKAKMGWLVPVDYTLDSQNVQFPSAATTPFAAKLWKDGLAGQQYFLVENRFTNGFDAALPGAGLLIWHIDETKGGDIAVWNKDNTQTWYPISFAGAPAITNNGNFHVALMQADNLWQLNLTNKALQNRGDAGDPFPGSTGNRLFGPSTALNSQAYNVGATPGYDSFVTVSNISDPGLAMTADIYTRSPNSGPLVDWVNIAGVVPPYSGAQFSKLDDQHPVVIRAFPGVSLRALSQVQLYINRASDGRWWNFSSQQWDTNILSSNYNVTSSEQNGLTLAFVTGLPTGTNLVNGTHIFTVRVINSAAIPTEIQMAMTAAHAPEVSLSLPDNSVVNTLTNTFTAVATEDTGLGIQRVEFALFWDAAATEGGPSVRWYWSGTAWSTTPLWLGNDFPSHPPQATEFFSIGPDARDLLTEKQYTIQARAVDGFGDAVTNTISVFYDPGSAATIYWRYPADGNWFDPANWTPQRVPLATDQVVVNAPGDYTVTVNGGANVASLRFGRVVGLDRQHLAIPAGALTLGSGDTNKIYANATLDLGGSFSAGISQLSSGAFWNWTNGTVAGTVNIGNGAVLNANTTAGGTLGLYGMISNSGSIQLQSGGTVQLNGVSGGGQLINAPGGLFMGQGTVSISEAGYGSELFVNAGQLEARTGTFSLNVPRGNGGGSFVADAGATINYANNFSVTDGAFFLGGGTNLLSGGTLTLSGNVSSANLIVAGGTLSGAYANLLGNWLWNGGNLSGAMTLASNGVLNIEPGGGTLVQYATLTNTGAVLLQGAGVLLLNGVTGGGELVNQSIGQISSQGNLQIAQAGYGSEILMNSGLIQAQTGFLVWSGARGHGNGQFVAAVGATLDFENSFTIDPGGVVTGAGTNVINGGVLTLNGAFNAPNAVLGGGALAGIGGVIHNSLIWTNGTIAAGSSLTVATDATLTVLPAGGVLTLGGALTNAGTIRLQGNGSFSLNGVSGGGQLLNLPGAQIIAQGTVGVAEAGYGSESFVNSGLLRAQSGVFTLNTPRSVGSGQFTADPNATLNFANDYRLTSPAVVTGGGTNLISAGTFTLNGSVTLTNAILAGASLAGTNGVINGTLLWTSGNLAAGSFLTVAPQAVLNVVPAGGSLTVNGILTNQGTINLQGSGTLSINGVSGYGQLYNMPGARIFGQGSMAISEAGHGSELFINSGLLEILNGGLALNTPRGNSGGAFIADTGTTLNFVNSYLLTNGALLAGGGTNLLTAGTITLSGGVVSSNAVLAGATLAGVNAFLDGVWVWTNGNIAAGSFLTVPTNAVLNVEPSGGTVTIYGVLTNAGTTRLTGSGTLVLNGVSGGGELFNVFGGLLLSQGGVEIYQAGYGSELFVNTGKLETQSGVLTLTTPRGSGNGQYITDGGASLIIPSGYTFTSGTVIGGAGTNVLSGGTIEIEGGVTVSNIVLGGANFSGSNGVINGSLTWTNGSILAGSTMTVAPGAVLNVGLLGGDTLAVNGTLTNLGTVVLQGSGTLQINGVSGFGRVINTSGGVIDSQGSVQIAGAGYGSELFNNSGLLEIRSGGLTLNTPRGSSGGQFIADTTSVLNFVNSYSLTDGALLAGGGTNAFTGGTLTLAGNVTSSNAVLAGANLTGVSGVFNGNWIWNSGAFIAGSTLTVGTNGTLVADLAGGDTLPIYGSLTNAGMMLVQGNGTLQLNGVSGGGGLVNASGGLVDVTGAVSIARAGYATELFVNDGILANSSGTNTTTLSVPFQNNGIVYAENGVLSFSGPYFGSNPTLEFGLSGSNSYGSINFTGNVPLSGAVGAIFNNGYVPQTNSSYAVLTYASSTGLFTTLNLPGGWAWQTNYGAKSFTISILNATNVTALQLSNPKFSAQGFSLSFVPQAGQTYVLEYKNALTDPVWTSLETGAGSGGFLTLSDTNAVRTSRFYRVRLP